MITIEGLVDIANRYAGKLLASAGLLLLAWLIVWGYSIYNSHRRHKEIMEKLTDIEAAITKHELDDLKDEGVMPK